MFITTLGGVVQEGLVRSDKDDAPAKCTTVLISERTDGSKVTHARRLGLPVVTNDWVRQCYMKKQLLSYHPFLLLPATSLESPEEIILSDDSDQDPDFVPPKGRLLNPLSSLAKAAKTPKRKAAEPPEDSDQDPDFAPQKGRRHSFSCAPLPPPKAAKKPKRKSADPPAAVPSNPFKVTVTNDKGEVVDPDSLEGLAIFAKRGKRVMETTRQMEREFRGFKLFCAKCASIGPDRAQQMLDSKLPDREVARFLSLFIRDRINKTVYDTEGTVVPLDTSTTDRVVNQVCTMLAESTNYTITNNREFDIVRTTKLSMMRDAKARFGKGNKDHLSCGLRVAELNYILGSDVLSFYTPFGLQALFYFQLLAQFLQGGQGSSQSDERRDPPHLQRRWQPQAHDLHPLPFPEKKSGGHLQLQ